MAPRRALAMIGDLIYDATGQSGLNTRVLPDGRVEQSFQHTGKFWGEQGREIATAVSMWRPRRLVLLRSQWLLLHEGWGISELQGAGRGLANRSRLESEYTGSCPVLDKFTEARTRQQDDRSVRGRSERGRDGPRKGLGLEVGASTALFESSREPQKALDKGLLDSHG